MVKKKSEYSLAGEKRKLELMQKKEYYSDTASPLRNAAYKKIGDEEKKLKLKEGIGQQKEKVYKKSVTGKAEKLAGKLYKKYKTQKITSRKVMKKGKVSYKVRPYVPEQKILNQENKFFKNELTNEKRSLYFS